MRIAINGFGRMGRLVLRSLWGRAGLAVVGVNEIAGDAALSAHLLTFDSVHGRWDREVSADDGHMLVDGAPIAYANSATIAGAPWAEWGCDIVLECTGVFKDAATLAAYLEAGVKTVIVAAPVKTDALNIVYGINHLDYLGDRPWLLTAASCTTNCLAPIVQVVHELCGIRHGSITTIHDVTNTQRMVDKAHKDWRRARSALSSLIPTSTGSAKAIGLIFPELEGRLNGMAIRVPLLNASIVDAVFEVSRPTTAAEVNAAFAAAAAGSLDGILGYEERPLVSVDFLNDPRSSIVDALSTMVINETQVKVIAWYDNEWGYVNRMADLAAFVAAVD